MSAASSSPRSTKRAASKADPSQHQPSAPAKLRRTVHFSPGDAVAAASSSSPASVNLLDSDDEQHNSSSSPLFAVAAAAATSSDSADMGSQRLQELASLMLADDVSPPLSPRADSDETQPPSPRADADQDTTPPSSPPRYGGGCVDEPQADRYAPLTLLTDSDDELQQRYAREDEERLAAARAGPSPSRRHVPGRARDPKCYVEDRRARARGLKRRLKTVKKHLNMMRVAYGVDFMLIGLRGESTDSAFGTTQVLESLGTTLVGPLLKEHFARVRTHIDRDAEDNGSPTY